MTQPNLGIRPLAHWQANQIRLTAFLTPAAQSQDFNWWQAVVGESPETKTIKPKMGGVQEEGLVEPGKLTLSIAPDRVDWHFSVYEKKDLLPFPALLIIGPFPDVYETFLRFMIRWLQLDTCPPIQRIAFGAILILPVESRENGYRLLSNYLHALKIDPDESSDLLYQINRPRLSVLNLTDKRVNRLSKWSVITFQEGLLRFTPSGIEQSPAKEGFACRLEIDVNTSQNFKGELPRDLYQTIFTQLIDFGKEIILNGDIP
jgi:hypothetical protein